MLQNILQVPISPPPDVNFLWSEFIEIDPVDDGVIATRLQDFQHYIPKGMRSLASVGANRC